MLILIQYIATV